MVPLGTLFIPIAPMRVEAGSQSSMYGRFCLVLKVVFALGESVERPKMEYPVAVRGANSSRNKHA